VKALAVDSVIAIVPDRGRLPLHPSPFPLPDAVQIFAFLEVQSSVTELPTTCVETLAVSVTEGVGAAGSVVATGMYVTWVIAWDAPDPKLQLIE
jgi:hypothetical protein